jgi:nicotinamidase-related amidase
VPRLSQMVEGQRRRRRNWVHAADEHPGVPEGDRSIENDQRKLGTTRWSPRFRKGHSEGSAYKSLCGEVVLCWRVGRMGPHK